MDYAKMQAEHKLWLDAMYPRQLPDIPAAGMVEEAGELLHAILKSVQRQVWGPEQRQGDLRAKLIDAIGDCAIYVCSYCNSMHWAFADFNLPRSQEPGTPMELAVQLVECAAKHARSNGSMLLGNYVRLLKQITYLSDIDFEVAVMNTWAIVRERKRCE